MYDGKNGLVKRENVGGERKKGYFIDRNRKMLILIERMLECICIDCRYVGGRKGSYYCIFIFLMKYEARL